MTTKKHSISLLAMTVVVAFCSIIYELAFAQALTITFGGTVTRYSITIGLFLLFLGIGALSHSKLSKEKSEYSFLWVEIALCLLGPLGLFFIIIVNSLDINFFMGDSKYHVLLFISHIPIAVIGFLSGLELPLLSDLQTKQENAFAKTLGFDYIGSLLGTVIYALYLYPQHGIIRTALFIGFLNLVIAIWFFLSRRRLFNAFSATVCTTLIVIYSVALSNIIELEERTYKSYYAKAIEADYKKYGDFVSRIEIIEHHRTKYQEAIFYRIHYKDADIKDTCLNLGKHVQMCNSWVHTYHNGLIDVPLSFFKEDQHDNLEVLLIGGGDWIPVSKLTPYKPQIDHVDIDKEFVDLSRNHHILQQIHGNPYDYPSLHTMYRDGFSYLKNTEKQYDLIILDLPGLYTDKLLNFYSTEFYYFTKQALKKDGLVVAWAYSKILNPLHYKVLMETIATAGFDSIIEYSAYDEYGSAGESFYLLSNSTKRKPQLDQNPYTQEHRDIYQKELRWERVLRFDDISENSVFNPNLDIIIESRS